MDSAAEFADGVEGAAVTGFAGCGCGVDGVVKAGFENSVPARTMGPWVCGLDRATKGFTAGGAAFECVSDVFDEASGRGRGGLEATLVTSAKFVECDWEKQLVSGYDNDQHGHQSAFEPLRRRRRHLIGSSPFLIWCRLVDTFCLCLFLDIGDGFLLDMVIVPRRVVLSRKPFHVYRCRPPPQ